MRPAFIADNTRNYLDATPSKAKPLCALCVPIAKFERPVMPANLTHRLFHGEGQRNFPMDTGF
jgi:hypothetical protein